MVDYSPYVPMFQAAGQKWDIDPALLQAIARQEAGINDKGVPQTSPAGAHGIMQFMPQTAKEYGVNRDDAYSSIVGGAHKMSDLLQYYGGDIPSALAAYNGSSWDKGQAYARGVLDNYKTIQAEEAAAAKAQPAPPAATTTGQSVSEEEAKLPPQRNLQPGASQAPMHFDVSTTPGARTEYPISDAESKPASATPAAAPATDYGQTLYGQSAPAAPEKSAETPAAPDYSSTLYGPVPTQPAPAGPAAAPAAASQTVEGSPVVTPGAPSGQLTPGGGADLPSRSPYTPPNFAPTPETWVGRNITAPLAAVMHPDQLQPQNNYLLGWPGLQNAAVGLGQAARDIAQTGYELGDWADRNQPGWMVALDRGAASAGVPLFFQNRDKAQQLAGETAAYNKLYSPSWAATGGRLVGQIAGADAFMPGVPGAIARGTEAAATAAGVPTIGRYAAPILAGAVAGGAQNALVSGGYGEDPLQAAEQGALGGAVVGGVLGTAGNLLTNRIARQPVIDTARDLDIPLSAGDIGGPRSFIKAYEDTTAPLPGAGEAQKVEAQQQAITRVLTREMGEPEQDALRPMDMVRIRGHIGQRINAAASQIDVPASPQFMQDLANVENAAMQSGPTSPQAHNFNAIRDELLNQMANNGGQLPGPDFVRFLAMHGTLDNALRSNNLDVQQAARGVRDALFNAAAANPNANPGAIAAQRDARYQWKVEEAVRDNIERAGTGTEMLTFPKLAGNIERSNFWPGSPMARLAQLMRDIPSIASSGTAERSLRQKLIGLAPGEAGGAGIMWALTNPHSFDQYLAAIAAPVAGNIVGGRLSRFGGGLGLAPFEAASRYWNPLTPRVFGPSVGQNWLTQPQPAQ